MRKIAVFVLFLFLIGIFVFNVFFDKKVANKEKSIAVIRINGTLYGTSVESLAGRTDGADSIMRQLISAREDNNVVAVLIRMDTPGGSVTAAEEIGVELDKLRASGKYVVTSMGDTAASAGYWLASCTDHIFANPSTLTGSIGVYIPYMNIEELYKKIGVSQDRIKSGRLKDIMANDRPMTAEERQILQTMVDQMYDSFVKRIAQGRSLSEEDVRKLADGRIYTGKQAKDLGLVDSLGNYYDALDFTAKHVGIQGKPVVKEYRQSFSWQSILQMGILQELSAVFDIKETGTINYRGFY